MLATPAQWMHLYTSICSALSAFCFIGTSPHQTELWDRIFGECCPNQPFALRQAQGERQEKKLWGPWDVIRVRGT
jgi:hypothetical protein